MPKRAVRTTATICLFLAGTLACTRSLSTPLPSAPVLPASIQISPEASFPASSTPAAVYPAPDNLPAATYRQAPTPLNAKPPLPEQLPVEIPLTGPLSQPDAEISGMTWLGDQLVLLPQYPERFGDGQSGALFTIPKAEILAYLDGTSTNALAPRPLAINTRDASSFFSGYQGFEAIASHGDRVFLSVEIGPAALPAQLVSGVYDPARTAISLDWTKLASLPAQSDLPNLGYESLLVFGDRLVAIYEANGGQINPHPAAFMFDLDLALQDQLLFPLIEYRISDTSPPDEQGVFWAINLISPVDLHLMPASDPLTELFGQGATHASNPFVVERLVPFQFGYEGIQLAASPSIPLVLNPTGEARNWEAIAPLDSVGFLIATDQHPRTILAFIPAPQ